MDAFWRMISCSSADKEVLMLMLAAMSAILSLMRSASSNDAVTFSHSASGILPPSLASAVGPLSSVGTIAVGTCVTRRDVDVKVLVRREASRTPRAAPST